LLLLLLSFPSCGTAEENRFTNREVGFSLVGPKGWQEKFDGGGQTVHYTPTPWVDFPVLTVVLEDLSPEQENFSAVDFAKVILADFQKSYKTQLVESPTKVDVHGIEGAKFILDVENVKRSTNKVVWMRNLFYQFRRGRKVISLMAMVEREEFDKYRKVFEEAIQGFRWLEK